MKKSILLVLTLPLILGSCSLFPKEENPSQKSTEETSQTEGQSGTQTGGQSGQGTEGSGSSSTTGGGTQTGGEQTGGGTTGGGSGTGGEQTGGGTSETTNESVLKDVSEFNLNNGAKPSSVDFNEDITLTCDIGTNKNNPPAYYTSDSSLRFYFGNKLTISNSKGVIKRIVFNYNSANDDNLFSANVGSMVDYQTWNGSNSSVTFKVEGDSGNIKLYRLRVEYTTSGGGTSGEGTSTGGGTGGQTGGGTETGGGTTGGGGSVVGKDYTSTWPSQYQQYVVTYLNGMVPCFLDVNKKCLFNGYQTKTEETTGLPYFNPYIKNTSPGINYEYDYGGILRDAGFKEQESVKDEGVTWKVYTKGTIYVRFAKYKADDNIYYFDLYAFNDYFNTTTFDKAYTFQHDDKNLGLTSKYEQNNKTVTVNNWKITLNDIQKNSYYMQLKKDTGKIVIEGNVKGIYLEILRNSDAAFVKAGTSKSNAKYIFNNGYRFDFPDGTKYVEISAQSRVLEFEFFEIGY